MIKVSAILLAAGLAQRMGKDKLLLDYQGKSFIEHSIDLLSSLPVYERIIVTSKARSAHISAPRDIQIHINHFPENGMSESIHIGTSTASGTHYLFLTADQPKLTTADLLPMLDTALLNTGKIIFPLIDSKPNSPTIFPASFRSELLDLTGDNGGRIVRDANIKSSLSVKPECPENFIDIDRKEEYDGLV